MGRTIVLPLMSNAAGKMGVAISYTHSCIFKPEKINQSLIDMNFYFYFFYHEYTITVCRMFISVNQIHVHKCEQGSCRGHVIGLGDYGCL